MGPCASSASGSAADLLAVLVALLVPFLPSFAAMASAAPAGALASWKAKVLPFPASDVVYDTSRGRVLATVPSFQPNLGNELVELDPFTGALGRRVFVGSDLDQIALTDDGTTAYVSLNGSNRVARVDLATFAVAGSFSTAGLPGDDTVNDLETVPGRNDTVIASLGIYNYAGTWVFRDGVALPDSAPRDVYAARIVVADATTVYGYNDSNSDSGFTTFRLDDTGLHKVSTGRSAITGYADIEMFGDGVYSTSGMVIDPGTRQTTGSFPVQGLVHAAAADNRVTFLNVWTESDYRFSVFDKTTGAPLESRDFESLTPGGADVTWSRKALVATSAGFVTASNRAVVLFGPSVGGGTVALPPAPPSSIDLLQATVVDLDIADLVYDETRDLVYVAEMRRYDPSSPDRVLAVHPTTGQVVRSISFGTSPVQLAMSDDRSRLHVSLLLDHDLERPARIAQIDLATFSVVGSFPVALGDTWRPGVLHMAVMPGTADTLAVSVGDCCNTEGVAVYDAGVRRPNTTSRSTTANRIYFAGPSTLYGHELYGDLVDMTVDGSGLTRTATHNNVAPWFQIDAEMTEGLVYSDNGSIFDPAAAQLAGRLPAGGPVEAVPARNRAFVFDDDPFGSGRLYELDLARQRPIASRGFGGLGNAEHLVSTGDGLAISLDASTGNARKLLLLHPPGAPTISRIGPTSVSTGGGQWVGIWGSGFTGATSVSFGGTPAEAIRVDSGELMRALAPPHVAGPVTLTVTTPTGTSAGSPATTFTYVTTLPDVFYVTPATGPVTGGTTVTITGSGLRGAQSVTFGGVPGTGLAVRDDYYLQVVTPPSVGGEVPVVVTTTGGTTTPATSGRYTYVAAALPAVSSVSPSSGPAGGGTTVILSGSGLLQTQSVSFGGVAAASISMVDDATIRVVTPPSAAGEVSVVVTTPSGTTPAMLRFTYVPTVSPPPAFTPLTPARLLETRAAAGTIGYALPSRWPARSCSCRWRAGAASRPPAPGPWR